MACCEIVYLRFLAADMDLPCLKPTDLYVDNKGAVAIGRNPVSSTSLKHVLRRHFFLRDAVADGVVDVHAVESSSNLADLLTKYIEPQRMNALLSRILKGLS